MVEAEESNAQRLHPLKDEWFVYHIRAVKEPGNYDDACLELDYVHSIEEVFAVLNTLPSITLLPRDDSLVFSRKKIPPKYESFPDGFRISLFTKTKTQTNDCISRTVAAVLGESVTKVISSEKPIADIVRISHKPNRMYEDSARIEVWVHKSPYEKELEAYFRDLIKLIPGVNVMVSRVA